MNWGIIGFGIFGEKRLIPGFQKSGQKLLAITKRNMKQSKQKAEQHGIPFYYDDPVDLLNNDEIEAVFVATPNKLHRDHVVMAAKHGKHVLCEKPMAAAIQDAKAMKNACETNGISFMIAQSMRFAKSILKVKELIKSGVIGKITFIDTHFSFNAEGSKRKWIFDKDIAGGGAIFDIGVHMVDTTRFLLAEKQLLGFKGYSKMYDEKQFPGRDMDCSGSLLMNFTGGTQAKVFCSFEMPYSTSLEVMGTKGFIRTRNFAFVERNAIIDVFTEESFDRPEKTIKVNNENFYAAEIDQFARCIASGGANTYPGPDEGLLNQIILNKWNDGLSKDEIGRLMA